MRGAQGWIAINPWAQTRSCNDRVTDRVAPFPPGTVVNPDIFVAEKLENQKSVRRTDATLSVGDDLFLRSHPVCLKHLSQLVGRLDNWHVALGDEVLPL